ncbi:olfactory receptor 6F1-like [Rhinophrynus dorsalis]
MREALGSNKLHNGLNSPGVVVYLYFLGDYMQKDRRTKTGDTRGGKQKNGERQWMTVFLGKVIVGVFWGGFHDVYNFRSILFLIVLLIYILTITGNLLIILLVSFSKTLNSPMYFFLSHLSSCDLLLTTVISPYLMSLILTKSKIMSFVGCFTQFYFFCASTGTECALLSVMSYDRYLAICNPLHYSSLMSFQRCLHLVLCSWVMGFTLALSSVLRVLGLKFCGPNVIDHFFCDLAPLLQLSCSDTSFFELMNFVIGFPVTLLPLMFIIATYIYIFHTILRIPSTSGRQKTFYTCSSHLTVVSIYYGTLMTAYLFNYKEHSLNLSKALSFLYTVVTPFLNPIVYSLKNKDIKTVWVKLPTSKPEHVKKAPFTK